jgi:hypothetical protein
MDAGNHGMSKSHRTAAGSELSCSPAPTPERHFGGFSDASLLIRYLPGMMTPLLLSLSQ